MRLSKKLAYCQHDKGSGVPRAEEEPTAKAAALGKLPERGKPGPEFVLLRFSFIVRFLPFLKNIRSLSYVPQTFCPFIIPHFISSFHFLVFHECHGDAWGPSHDGDFKGKAFECFPFFEEAAGGWRCWLSLQKVGFWSTGCILSWVLRTMNF